MPEQSCYAIQQTVPTFAHFEALAQTSFAMPTLRILPLFCWLLAATAGAQPTDIPFSQPGKCYAQCLIHDQYELVSEQLVQRPAWVEMTPVPARLETVSDRYISREGYTRLVAEPAVFETVEETLQIAPAGRREHPERFEAVQEQVLIQPATKYYEVIDAVFETVMEPVELEPAYLELEVLPQKFENVVEQIEVRPASTRWIRKKSDRDCLSANPDDCFVWCMAEVPAQFQTLYKQDPVGCDGMGGRDSASCATIRPVAAKTSTMPVQRVKTPPQARELVAPAEYQTVTRWVLKAGATAPAGGTPEILTIRKKVLKTPARVREEEAPPQYKPITRKKVAVPAHLKYEDIPAAYVTVTKRSLVRKGGFTSWREVLCNEKLTGYTVRQIQEALRALGYYKGPVNGTLTTQTQAALAEFQKDRALPADGKVDFETLRALGVQH